MPVTYPKCEWGRDPLLLMLDENALPCSAQAVTTAAITVIPGQPLEGVEITVCEEHLIQVVELVN